MATPCHTWNNENMVKVSQRYIYTFPHDVLKSKSGVSAFKGTCCHFLKAVLLSTTTGGGNRAHALK